MRSYLSEPEHGRRDWSGKAFEKKSVYGNRRRIRGGRGKRLLRSRGELVERPFAHCYETGGMRRTHLRGHENILKRLLVYVAGSNLGLLMCRRYRYGTPKGLAELCSAFVHAPIRLACRSAGLCRHPHVALGTAGRHDNTSCEMAANVCAVCAA